MPEGAAFAFAALGTGGVSGMPEGAAFAFAAPLRHGGVSGGVLGLRGGLRLRLRLRDAMANGTRRLWRSARSGADKQSAAGGGWGGAVEQVRSCVHALNGLQRPASTYMKFIHACVQTFDMCTYVHACPPAYSLD